MVPQQQRDFFHFWFARASTILCRSGLALNVGARQSLAGPHNSAQSCVLFLAAGCRCDRRRQLAEILCIRILLGEAQGFDLRLMASR